MAIAATYPYERSKKFKILDGVALANPISPRTTTKLWSRNYYLVILSIVIGQKLFLFVLGWLRYQLRHIINANETKFWPRKSKPNRHGAHLRPLGLLSAICARCCSRIRLELVTYLPLHDRSHEIRSKDGEID